MERSVLQRAVCNEVSRRELLLLLLLLSLLALRQQYLGNVSVQDADLLLKFSVLKGYP